jgi:hypothetical protein
MESVMTNPRSDRRCHRRYPRPELRRIVSARIRPGYDVSVIDVSAGGALLESERRLLPGSPAELHVRFAHRSEIVRGHIVRCAVARLCANAIWYRGAMAFDAQLPSLLDEAVTGYVVPEAETRPNPASWAGATQGLP